MCTRGICVQMWEICLIKGRVFKELGSQLKSRKRIKMKKQALSNFIHKKAIFADKGVNIDLAK